MYYLSGIRDRSSLQMEDLIPIHIETEIQPSSVQNSRMSPTSLSELPEEMLRRILRLLPPSDLKTAMLVSKLWKSMVEDPNLWTWVVVSVKTSLDLHRLKIHRLQLIQMIRLPPSDRINSICKPEDLGKLFQVVLDIPSITMIHGIENYDLGSIEPCLLGQVLGKLDVLKLNAHRDLSSVQLEHILTTIAERKSPMKELLVVGLWVDDLSPTLFASAGSNVKKLVLSVCDEDQMLALLQGIVDSGRPLAKLHLTSCSMDSINQELVGKALNKLDEVVVSNCRYGWVSHDQLTATFRGVLEEESKLKNLMLNDISSYAKGIDEELLRQTFKKIGKFWSRIKKVVDAYQEELIRLGAIAIFD